MELTLSGVTKTFRDRTVVNGISARLTPGIYGLLGANGAGKTTLMRMICGVLDPTAGTVSYDGIPIQNLGERYYARLGYLPQDFNCYPDFTARQFLRYMAAVKGLRGPSAKRRVEEMLDLVNLADAADRRVGGFSGGMKRRLGIAQAELADPSVLVFDEPTAGLDPKERVRVRSLLASLAHDKIVLLSTHIVSDIASVADVVLMMKAGSLVHASSMDDATAALDGKIWELETTEENAARLMGKFTVLSVDAEGTKTLLRIASDGKPARGARPATASLEDLFLLHFNDRNDC